MKDGREKVIERIRKLLAMSEENGATEAEAVSAVMMAQRLMSENDVEDWELHSSDEQPIETARSEPATRRWRWKLAETVASNFRCRYYQSASYERERGFERTTRMVFYGYKTDAQAAAIAFDYLYKIGDKLGKRCASRAYREHGYSDGAYNGFVVGFVNGVAGELEKQAQALMIIVPPRVNESYESFSEGFGKANSKVEIARTIFAGEAYENGLAEGREAVRARRIEADEPQEDFGHRAALTA